MKYQLTPIHCRPWLLNSLSLQLIESHYENNYGGALRRLNAITEKLEALDFANTPPYVLNGLKRDQLVALNSTLLHELYFASMGGDGKPNACSRRRSRATSGGRSLAQRVLAMRMGFRRLRRVLLVYVARDGRLMNQYASDHSLSIAGGIPVLALDMYEHAYHIDFGANRRPISIRSCATSDWMAVQDVTKTPPRSRRRGRSCRKTSAIWPGARRRGSESDIDPASVSDHRCAARHFVCAPRRTSWKARCGAIPTAVQEWAGALEVGSRGSRTACTAFTSAAGPRSRCGTQASRTSAT